MHALGLYFLARGPIFAAKIGPIILAAKIGPGIGFCQISPPGTIFRGEDFGVVTLHAN